MLATAARLRVFTPAAACYLVIAIGYSLVSLAKLSIGVGALVSGLQDCKIKSDKIAILQSCKPDTVFAVFAPFSPFSSKEVDALNRSQIATGSQKHRDPRFPPYAFTEHGAIMAATMINSPRALDVR